MLSPITGPFRLLLRILMRLFDLMELLASRGRPELAQPTLDRRLGPGQSSDRAAGQ